MAGVSSATLEGWAIPALYASFFDHTYVVSSCGLRWGCHGRSTGGNLLRGRVGNSIIADCLAQPTGLAGIKYGITGVCHQIANRILPHRYHGGPMWRIPRLSRHMGRNWLAAAALARIASMLFGCYRSGRELRHGRQRWPIGEPLRKYWRIRHTSV